MPTTSHDQQALDTMPRAKMQGLIDAINREGGWQDTDAVAELLTQFLDSEGFSLTPVGTEMPRGKAGRDYPCPDCGGVGSPHIAACDPY